VLLKQRSPDAREEASRKKALLVRQTHRTWRLAARLSFTLPFPESGSYARDRIESVADISQ